MTLWLAALVCLSIALATPLPAQPVRMASTLFGEPVEIEVRDLNSARAREAIAAAFDELHRMSVLTDAGLELPGGVGWLNAGAGQGPRPVIQPLGELLRRSQHFCLWSNGNYGPLGGVLYHQLERLAADNEGVDATAFRDAVLSARCDRLRVALPTVTDDEPAFGPADAGTLATSAGSIAGDAPDAGVVTDTFMVTLAAGSQLDLRGWSRGFAIDRAFELLREHGARNVWIETPKLRRAAGPGAEGKGWLVALSFPGVEQPLSQIWLRDQALAVTTPLERAGADPHFVSHQNGRPTEGIVAVVTVSELAVDAEGLATILAVIGLHEGKMRLGALRPQPSVLWLLGKGGNRPIEAEFRWAELPKKLPRR